MSPNEYQAAKDKLGLSHEKLGELLGISRRQSQRYAYGEATIPKCVGIVLRDKTKASQ